MREYWAARESQSGNQKELGRIDTGTRNEVTGGQHLSAFTKLLCEIAHAAGFAESEVRFKVGVEHVDWMLQSAPSVPYVIQANALQLVLQGDHAGGLSALGELNLEAFDGHLTFHFTEIFALTGEIERAMETLALAVKRGFSPVDFIAKHCTLIEPLRSHPKFPAIVATATARMQKIRDGLVRQR